MTSTNDEQTSCLNPQTEDFGSYLSLYFCLFIYLFMYFNKIRHTKTGLDLTENLKELETINSLWTFFVRSKMKGAKGLSLFFFQPEQSLSSGHYAVYIYLMLNLP